MRDLLAVGINSTGLADGFDPGLRGTLRVVGIKLLFRHSHTLAAGLANADDGIQLVILIATELHSFRRDDSRVGGGDINYLKSQRLAQVTKLKVIVSINHVFLGGHFFAVNDQLPVTRARGGGLQCAPLAANGGIALPGGQGHCFGGIVKGNLKLRGGSVQQGCQIAEFKVVVPLDDVCGTGDGLPIHCQLGGRWIRRRGLSGGSGNHQAKRQDDSEGEGQQLALFFHYALLPFPLNFASRVSVHVAIGIDQQLVIKPPNHDG